MPEERRCVDLTYKWRLKSSNNVKWVINSKKKLF